MKSRAKKCKKRVIFHRFRKKSRRVRSRKIPPKRRIFKRLASGESWDNSLPGVSGFGVSRMSSCTLKLCRKSKHRKKCESTCAFWRNLTPAKKRENSTKRVFGSWPCLYWHHIPSLVELGCFGGLPELFECTAPVLSWLPPLIALWILGLLALKLT